MQKYSIFLGIDIGKENLWVCLFQNPEKYGIKKFSNTPKGYAQLLRWLSSQVDLARVLFCMEHTGVYTHGLCNYLSKKDFNYTLIPAVEIQRSLGLRRGKNDPRDAKHIAEYAYRFADQLTITRLPEKALQKLQILQAHRKKLIKMREQVRMPLREAQGFVSKEVLATIAWSSKALVKHLEQDIEKANKEMQQIVKENALLKEQFKLITSIIGIGPHTAYYLLVATQAFTRMTNSRALACFAGTAPFPKQSGKSKAPDQISVWGDQKLKTLLTNAAMSAIRHDREMKAYYQRKTEVDGKSKRCVINAVRNKLLARVVAVIKRGQPFEVRAKY